MRSWRLTEPRLQRWLSRSLEPTDLRARLAKGDPRGGGGAFYELALESHFRARGIRMSKPTLASGRPDLLIHDPSGDVYLEVATVFDTEFWDEASRRADVVAAAIQKVRSPYWINLQTHERDLPPDVTPRKIRTFVERVIQDTKAGHLQLEQTHAIPGTSATFHLWGEHEEGPLALGMTRSDVRAMSGHVQVERAIDDKASKYPEIASQGKPYVVAICSGHWFAIDEEQVTSGVYGTQQVTFYVPRGPVTGPIPEPTSARRGGMLAQRPDGAFNNREISAVLHVWEDFETTGDSIVRARVLHHVHPLVPLPLSVFSHLPQTTFERIDDDQVRIVMTMASTALELD